MVYSIVLKFEKIWLSGTLNICQNRKIKKKYVDCLTYKNFVWPLSSYENQSNANIKIISVENKYRVKGQGCYNL